MPIYEYQCANQQCIHYDNVIEVTQRMSDDPLVQCPYCQEDSLKKKISVSSFRLKGGGWYETDFKTNGQKRNLATSENSVDKSSNISDNTVTANTAKDSQGSTSSSE